MKTSLFHDKVACCANAPSATLASPNRNSAADGRQLSAETEAGLTLKALHSTDAESFRSAIDPLLTQKEKELIRSAEQLALPLQAVYVYDEVVRRLTLHFADLIGWARNAIADIVEPRTQITPQHAYVVLDLPKSRDLEGCVAFRALDPQTAQARFPDAALETLTDTRQYWQRVTYLEPVFHQGRVLRSLRDVRRFKHRPKDPIIACYLGAGAANYGYEIVRVKRSEFRAERVTRCHPVVFILAHWDD